MLRAGRFRHRLLEDSFLQTHADDLHRALSPFLELWRQKQLQDFEIAAVYILIFSFFRRPDDFLGGVHGDTNLRLKPGGHSPQGITGREVIKLLKTSLPVTLQNKKILNRLDTADLFVQVFCSFSWRSIPLAASRSIRAWHEGLYPLNLLTAIPSPEEVLDLQCAGRRCVSMLIEPEQIRSFVEEGRDVLGFIIHDLIHADHFFADAHNAEAQIYFSQKLQRVYALPQIQDLLSGDAVFRTEFYYLMSDMNSVPLHLLKTLKAVLLGYFKRLHGKGFNSPLCPQTESEFLDLFQLSLGPWNFDESARDAAIRLNTPSSRTEDYLLLDVALNKQP